MSDYIERYWRDATPQDAIKEPPMVARFRDRGKVKWTEVPLRLMGLCRASCVWSDTDGYTFHYCQVYDAPDPGEGWRLVDVDSEKPQAGDEFKFGSGWVYCNEFLRDTFYASNQVIRRRIEPPKPEPKYVPFTWEDREQLRGRWIGSNDGRCERLVNVMHHDSGCFYANAMNAESLCADWRFMDTGDPVGKRVQ